MPVVEVQQRAAGASPRTLRRLVAGQEQHGDEHHHGTSTTTAGSSRRRAGASRSARGEIAPGLGALGEQQRRDQVAAEDEEHVDAEEAAGEPAATPRVEEQHAGDRDGAQTVERGDAVEQGGGADAGHG